MTPSNSAPDDAVTMRKLAVGINTSLIRLDRLSYQIQLLKEELDDFLHHYFDRLSPHLHHAETPASASDINKTETDAAFEEITADHTETRNVMRQLYRQLAIACHPDLHPADASHASMTKVNEAYRNGEFGSLMLLARTMRRETGQEITFSREDMEYYYDSLQTKTEKLQKQMETLQRSDASLLRLHYLKARLNGGDVIADVVATLRRTSCDAFAA